MLCVGTGATLVSQTPVPYIRWLMTTNTNKNNSSNNTRRLERATSIRAPKEMARKENSPSRDGLYSREDSGDSRGIRDEKPV